MKAPYAFNETNLGPYIVHLAEIVKGFELEFIVSQPDPSKYLSESRTVLKGAIQIDITCEGYDPYTSVSNVGDHVNVKPRDGLTAYANPVKAVLTTLEDTTYVCIRTSNDMIIGQEKVVYKEPIALVPDTIAICLSDFSINGTDYVAKDFILAKEGDVLTAPLDSTVLIYTASWR